MQVAASSLDQTRSLTKCSDGIVDHPAAFDVVGGGPAEEERAGTFFGARNAAIGVAVRSVDHQGRK